MTPPSLPPDVFDTLPPAVRAYIRHLEARLADLEARLGRTAANRAAGVPVPRPSLVPSGE